MIKLPKQFKVACHTDHVGPGSTFVAIPGSMSNGALYISNAIDRGANQIVVQKGVDMDTAVQERCSKEGIEVVVVENARLALAQLSAKAYDYPARKLKIIGITGTKGKTTSVYLLNHILQQAGHKVAMLTGVENKIGDQNFPAELTTPHPDYIHMFFEQCVRENVEYVVMEASAQGFSLHRLEGLEFDAMVFTNFSLEHSEFYSDIEDYFEAKCQIFEHCKEGAPRIVNADDTWVKRIISAYDNLTTTSLTSSAKFAGTLKKADMAEVQFEVAYGSRSTLLKSQTIVGPYNAENILGVFSCAVQLGINPEVIQRALESFTVVPGRLERFELSNDVVVVIDYAHNPSSFQALFAMLHSNTSDLTVVFGCGGGRDNAKRPIMGELAARYCSKIYLTNDNPRTDDPDGIIQDILLGIPQEHSNKVTIEKDRAKAISRAIENARPNGIVAILGKGPDEYQLIGTTKTFFSDKQEVSKLIYKL
ncbi:MAG TPA: UDP-N-acetylmuramoyl-L-alanyl-D-glutamate--2,6-diaminopimelate ligase [Candidatus Babeliales bacterium]|nr:UDP-N-acetylmuramoyl-L-alanyl-D-glutamate--2,6-diaminopimelate ligase [Candidatus Babeliales bacterium]